MYDVSRQRLGSTFAVSILLLVLFATSNWQSVSMIQQQSVPLTFIGEWLQQMGEIPVFRVLLHLLVLLNGVIITRMGTKNMLYVGKTYMPILFYPIIFCGIFFHPQSINIALGSLFLIISLQLFIKSFIRTGNASCCFSGAISLSVAGIIFPPLFITALFMPFVLRALYRSFREISVAIFGLLTPIFIVSYFSWAAGSDFMDLSRSIIHSLVTGSNPLLSTKLPADRIFVVAILLILTAASLWGFISTKEGMRTHAYRILLSAILIMVSFVVVIALSYSFTAGVQLMAIPLAVILPYFFVRFPGKFSLSLYMLFIFSVVMVNIASLF